jgi:hypothetical protein
VSSETQSLPAGKYEVDSRDHSVVDRRSFLRKMGIVGVSLAPATALLLSKGNALAKRKRREKMPSGGEFPPADEKEFILGVTQGDVDILRFAAAAEILETDLWQQYTELGGAGSPTGANLAYTTALQNLDMDMPQYIADNTDDEDSHQKFLNAFLMAVGAEPVNLDAFRHLQGSTATGVDKTKVGKRLTNLTQLNIDTGWYTRYRSTENPDFGDTFTGPVTIMNRQSIPINDGDASPKLPVSNHMQAIANTAAFHFATIEQGGSSLYGSFIPRATSRLVLRILYAIGGSEVNHFAIWHDKAGGAVSTPLAPLTDNGLMFPDLNAVTPPAALELTQTNLIMPEPCDFISEDLPDCSIIRPTLRKNAGAIAAAKFLTNMGLFNGQPPAFFDTLFHLAEKADIARRESGENEEDQEEEEILI